MEIVPDTGVPKCDPVHLVELTEDEERTAIYNAKWKKYEVIRKKQLDEAYQAAVNFYCFDWTPEKLFNFVLWRASQIDLLGQGREFVVDDSNAPVIELLCYYFTNDHRFVELGRDYFKAEFSLNKGILLRGATGRGKSEIMKLFAANPKSCYDFRRTEEINSEYKEHGDPVIYRYATYRRIIGARTAEHFFQDQVGSCWDDFGTEEPASHYGPSVLVMQKIIQTASNNRNLPWYLQHLTTMLTPDDMQEKYGAHIRSRIRERFNDVLLEGPDRR